MDPLTTSALTATITALLNGVAGEAGKSAWAALTATVRSAFGGKSAQVSAVEAVQRAVVTPSDPAGLAEAAAVQLLAGAQADPSFGEFLAGWQAETTTLIQGSHSVTNVVSGNAQVRSLIQARDLHGDITFN